MSLRRITPFAIALLPLGSGAALATGVVPAPADPPPVVLTAPTPDWAGFYGGVSLGYGIGTYGNGDNFPFGDDDELEGMTYGLFGGYNFQNGNWVYGPEIAIIGSQMAGSESCINPTFTCEVDINYMGALRGNVGYLVSPETLLFGTLGIVSANTDVFTDNGTAFGEDHFITGYQLGLGVEYALSETTHLRGTVSHYMFDEGDYETDVSYSDIDMDATVFEVGLLFRF